VLCQQSGEPVAKDGLAGRDGNSTAQIHEEVDDGQAGGCLTCWDLFLD
jgi:hypothetical protein